MSGSGQQRAAQGDSAAAPGSPRRRRSRSERARERRARFESGEHDHAFVSYFKERVYVSFTGLAIVLVVAGGGHPEAPHAFIALLLGVVGITAAGFVSDVISHLAVHREFPDRTELTILFGVMGGALGTLVAPCLLIGLAWLDVLSIETALRASMIVYIVTLGVIGWLAVRRSHLPWGKQLLVLGMLIALGLGVVALEALAHLV